MYLQLYMNHKYSVNIVWSDEDKCYLVELPEFSNALQRYFTHGDTYAEAIAWFKILFFV